MGRQPSGRQEDEIKQIFRQLVKAVQRVHMHGIFHGRLWKESSRSASNNQPKLLLGNVLREFSCAHQSGPMALDFQTNYVSFQ
jgi:hypothetical protein